MALSVMTMLAGLGLAAWGHLLVHDMLGAAEVWKRADERFPLALRTPPPVAGVALLIMGTVCVLLAIAR